MIKNWKQHSLYMNFKKCDVGNEQPSDIDMVYLSKHGDLVIGEIKNETAFIRRTLNKAQFKRLKGIADKYINNALIIYISHNKYVENGDEEVDISQCEVKYVYYNRTKKLKVPKYRLNVKQFLEKVELGLPTPKYMKGGKVWD